MVRFVVVGTWSASGPSGRLFPGLVSTNVWRYEASPCTLWIQVPELKMAVSTRKARVQHAHSSALAAKVRFDRPYRSDAGR